MIVQERILRYAIKLVTKLTKQKRSLELIDCMLTELLKLPKIEHCYLYEVHHSKGGTIHSLLDAKQLRFKDILEKPWQAKDSTDVPCALTHCILKREPITSIVENSELTLVVYPFFPNSTGVTRLLCIESKDAALCQQIMKTSVVDILNNLFILYDQLERDSLTGLFNQYLLENSLIDFSRLATLFTQNANRKGQKPWLAMIQSDSIEKFQAKPGSSYSDDAELIISRTLKNCFRSSDLLFRHRDRCFAALLICDSAEEVECALNRLYKDLGQVKSHLVTESAFHISFTPLANDKPALIALEELNTSLDYSREKNDEKIVNFDKLNKLGTLKISAFKVV